MEPFFVGRAVLVASHAGCCVGVQHSMLVTLWHQAVATRLPWLGCVPVRSGGLPGLAVISLLYAQQVVLDSMYGGTVAVLLLMLHKLYSHCLHPILSQECLDFMRGAIARGGC